jgi:transcriptional regulator with XRE-family HTH domain
MTHKTDSIEFVKLVGLTIKMLRLKHNMSQEELAFKADMDRAHIGKIERGETNITIMTLKNITDVFDISMHEFFEQTETVERIVRLTEICNDPIRDCPSRILDPSSSINTNCVFLHIIHCKSVVIKDWMTFFLDKNIDGKLINF